MHQFGNCEMEIAALIVVGIIVVAMVVGSFIDRLKSINREG